jgi:EAL domain-containing protein (putative c-di-GMP-specific phosphodiesterase class I)
MSVNLSAVQFRNRNLPDTVADALRGANLDPACLALELTESVMVGYADSLMETLEALKALGVRIVLDDFGTGYSSLAYLTRLPLDALKVDRSFIDGLGTEPRDTAVTEAIIAMALALSLQVVGEGDRDRASGDRAEPLGLRHRAGLSLLRPLPAGEITRACCSAVAPG